MCCAASNAQTFQIIEGDYTWYEAKADAESRGGRLAVLNTQEKIDDAQNFLDSLGSWPEFYIGLTDKDIEGEWRWINGTILTVSNWRQGEPNNAANTTGEEDFALVTSSNDPNYAGKWGDNTAHYLRDYLYAKTNDPGGYLLEIAPSYTMYGLNHETDSLVTINLDSGLVTTVGSLGIDVGPFTGLDYDPSSKKLITALSPPGGYSNLYEINLSTGSANLINSIQFAEQEMEDDGINWLGFSTDGTLYSWNERFAFNTGDFWVIDTTLGTPTKIADSSLPSVLGADYQEGVGYWISDEWNGTIYRIDELTGLVEFTGVNNIWFTGNGPGDLHDLDYAPDDILRVAASDSSISASTLLTVNQDNGLEISRLNLTESILSIASVPLDISENTAWYSDSSDLGNNWRYYDWLGYFNIFTEPWIYHMEHDWLYVFPSVTGPENIYFWDSDMKSVLWTSETTYPSMYRFSDNTWIWYLKTSKYPRWFNKLGTNDWEAYNGR